MPRATTILNQFNAGELSPRLTGRTDLAKYFAGAKEVINFLPTVQGALVRRAGTRFVKEVKDSTNKTALIPFKFSTEDAYILEFGNLYMRVYRNRGVVLESNQTITDITQANPAVVTITGHTFLDGEEIFITDVAGMTEINGSFYIVANKTANNFELTGVNSTGFTAYTSGGTAAKVFELVTQFTTADLFDSSGRLRLSHSQSADVLFLAHPEYTPQSLTRTSNTDWTISDLELRNGPFRDQNTDESLTIFASAETGSVTITASSALFTVDHVDSLWRVFQEDASAHGSWETNVAVALNDVVRYLGRNYECTDAGTTGTNPPIHSEGEEWDGTDQTVVCKWLFLNAGFGTFKITAFTSSTVVTATVVKRLPARVIGSGNTSFKWSEAAWSDERGWPSVSGLHESRGVWCATTKEPDRIDLTRSNGFSDTFLDFEQIDASGAVLDDSAIARRFNSDTVNKIEWVKSTDKGLLCGTAGGIWVVSPSTLGQAITPFNVNAKQANNREAAAIDSVKTGEVIIYTQRNGRSLREVAYVFESDGFNSPDLNRLSEHIAAQGIIDMEYQKTPDQIVWCIHSNGELLGMTYERLEDVVAWHRHTLSGNAESLAVIPSPDTLRDDLWVIVNRTIDGSTRRYVEYMEAYHETGDLQEDAFYVDSGLTYSGAAATVITGLDHLEGETVQMLAAGGAVPDQTVVDGSITLAIAATPVQIGLGYVSSVETMNVEAGGIQGQTAQGLIKRIHFVIVRFVETLGGFLIATDDNGDTEEVEIITEWGLMDNPPNLFSADKKIEFPDTYNRAGTVRYEQRQPFPVMITAMIIQLKTSDG